MTWIRTIPFEKAKGRVKLLYQRIKGPDDSVDNIMMAHSLRPHTMEGHMALYKNVLHHTRNTVPAEFMEVLGVYVSLLNGCDYCVQHHLEGLKRLLKDEERVNHIMTAFNAKALHVAFSGKELAAVLYARKLTTEPTELKKSDIDHLKLTGWNDAEILEINQVVAYFAYANRVVLGLGLNTDGDIIGLSPKDSDNDDNWGHQ